MRSSPASRRSTAEDILEVVREVYSGPYVIGAVGPFDEGELEPYVA